MFIAICKQLKLVDYRWL